MKKIKKYDDNRPAHITTRNVFSDLGFDGEESAALKIKSDLLFAVQNIVEERGYKQRDLEKLFDQPQSRISELLNGKISKMSIEKLLGYLEKLGGTPSVKIHFKKRAA
jgi:predicted XRE-type DNA-binding protein